METTEIKSLIDVEFLFEETINLTGITEFGTSWADITAGRIPPPANGARFDLTFEGVLTGPGISGTITGTDFLEVRADGRFMLNIHAFILTDDGENISVHENGLLLPVKNDPGNAGLSLNLKFNTASQKYAWLNKTNAIATGNVKMNEGKVYASVYNL